jgi:hypothetical protein
MNPQLSTTQQDGVLDIQRYMEIRTPGVDHGRIESSTRKLCAVLVTMVTLCRRSPLYKVSSSTVSDGGVYSTFVYVSGMAVE